MRRGARIFCVGNTRSGAPPTRPRRFCLGEGGGPCDGADVTAANEPEAAGPVLLFDGECGLCQRVVRLLLRLDRRGGLRFAPLQGSAAQEFLRSHGWPTEDFDTLVFVPDWSRRMEKTFLLRTAGAVAALRAGGGAGRGLGYVLAIMPAALRDAGYRVVARVRRRLFGPGRLDHAWRQPWSARFLD